MEVPSERDEIERKTLETCEWLISLKNTKQITPEVYRFGFSVLNQAVSGLIDDDIHQAIWKEMRD